LQILKFLDPSDIPSAWIEKLIGDAEGKACGRLDESCKKALGPACYSSGTPCLAVCNEVKAQCEIQQEELLNSSPVPSECPPGVPIPEPDPLTPECTYGKWLANEC